MKFNVMTQCALKACRRRRGEDIYSECEHQGKKKDCK